MKKLFIIVLFLPLLLFSYSFHKFGFKDFKIVTYCNKILHYPYQYRCYDYKLREPRVVLYYINQNVNKLNYKKRLSFKEDNNIPYSFQNKLVCYKKSGYDRGHMASDADFDYNLTILKTTYLTSNIVPMFPKLNRYSLLKYEKYERKLAENHDVVVLMGISGNSYKRLKNRYDCAIIPKYIFKIFFIKENNYYTFDYGVILDQKGIVIKKITTYPELKVFLIKNKIKIISYKIKGIKLFR